MCNKYHTIEQAIGDLRASLAQSEEEIADLSAEKAALNKHIDQLQTAYVGSLLILKSAIMKLFNTTFELALLVRSYHTYHIIERRCLMSVRCLHTSK